MAIQWADSFSRYGVGNATRDRMRDGLPYNNWESKSQIDPDPLAAANGERCCYLHNVPENNACGQNRIALPTPTAGTVGVAARYWFPSFTSVGEARIVAAFMPLNPASNNYPDNLLASCRVESNGALSIISGVNGGYSPIATTGGPVVSTNAWNHIETSYNGTTGGMEVRLNGITVLTGTSAKTGTIYFANPIAGAGGTPSDVPIKDLVIWDGSGSRNNTFMGSVVVRRKAPQTDVTLGGWVPSTGSTGVPLLAKTAPNDTTYLSADGTPPAAMRYTLENLPDEVTSVRGIVTVVRARKIDGGDANLQTSLISGGDVDPGADRPITTTFTYWYDISETDPDTGNAWTPASFDAADVEIDRTL